MAKYVAEQSYDYLDFGDDSEEEKAESSEDEIDIILNGTPEQRRHLHHNNQRFQHGRKQKKREPRTNDFSSSEDEFEREMNAELDKTVRLLEKTRDVSCKASKEESVNRLGGSSSSSTGNGAVKTDQHDGKSHHQSSRLSNDDLLYDPEMDDDDQRWVDHQRQIHRGIDCQNANNNSRKLGKNTAPRSDAVLDCPACLTTLCIDCQRHEVYHNQYRAMFVMNCKIDTSELLEVPEQASKKKSKSKKFKPSVEEIKSEETSTCEDKDKFHPVKCEECDTVVGVIDLDEVYHFFNVLASYA